MDWDGDREMLVLYPHGEFSGNDSMLAVIGEEYFVGAGIFTFVLSIVHLTKYKKKAFAIVALVISSIIVLLFLIVLAGLMQGVQYSPIQYVT